MADEDPRTKELREAADREKAQLEFDKAVAADRALARAEAAAARAEAAAEEADRGKPMKAE